jgi:hypothetical protein
LPYPLPNLSNRLKSKYIKIQTHRFLPEYDAYIWLDGSIEVVANSFVSNMLEKIDTYDVAIYQHQERKSAYEEIEYIIENMRKGNKYLLSRYGDQQIQKELCIFEASGLSRAYPLFSCYAFIRLNNEKVNNAFDEWWRKCIEFSDFDQAMFSYIANKCDLNINILQYDTIRTYKLFKRNQHL